mmetsp:Transcript_34153/g.55676  ORF Transcript_34153/g.55676 Transcript_34153/m.55676 type:complete len:362 (-) Transcript_34153:180-1265(-)|eukprot:CAMPEP_0202687730 /NCGR_PEP_ID=MMETSP1385-20130828/3369_1 /ASSEMBLY_ACC=CAM_ASM_000861 /TAXON_ID=933848 /ORGANISM="Elphidium margaritaceum" /LENGTH=361 /DNA_ID=CAMNT_0049342571 /DNA_START=26 /DNA_END=1111 /DNA_ORIENTATION=+
MLNNSSERAKLNCNETFKIQISSYGALSEHNDGSVPKYHDGDNDMRLEPCIHAELSRFTLQKINVATQISLVVNIILFFVKISVFAVTGSWSVIAALIDSMCDLISQAILFYTYHAVRRPPTAKFPAGNTRLEPVGILIMSIIMIILSFSVVFGSGATLYTTYAQHASFSVGYSLWSILLMVTSIALKFCLWIYCRQFTKSPSAMALAQDHRNDVLSNGTALFAVCIASQFHKAVWIDPASAILISLYIIYSWYNIGNEEINKLVGIHANDENMQIIHNAIQHNLGQLHSDRYKVCGYHIGRNMLVELCLIYEKCLDYQSLCDTACKLQHKLEAFNFVERAFVRFDYKKREKPAHKTPFLD